MTTETFMARPPRWVLLLALSAVMLLGTGIAFNCDLQQWKLPSALSMLVEGLVVVCVFGWLPMLVGALVSLRRQTTRTRR